MNINPDVLIPLFLTFIFGLMILSIHWIRPKRDEDDESRTARLLSFFMGWAFVIFSLFSSLFFIFFASPETELESIEMVWHAIGFIFLIVITFLVIKSIVKEYKR